MLKATMKARSAISQLLLMTSLIFTAGCFKTTEVRLVYVSLERFPEGLEGVMRIATNDPIAVTVEGKDHVVEADLGGRIVVFPADMKTLVEEVKKIREGL